MKNAFLHGNTQQLADSLRTFKDNIAAGVNLKIDLKFDTERMKQGISWYTKDK